MAGTGDRVAPPKAPAPSAAPGVALDVGGLDELYPDVDGVHAEGQALLLSEARTVDLLRSHLRGCTLDAPADCAVEARDSVLEGVDLVGRRIAGLVRTHLVRCRLTGTDLSDASLEDVTFEDCALDMSSWRMARLKRVCVLGGRIDSLDATGAALTDVAFAGVVLEGVVLEGTRCERVDLTGADLTPITAVASLAGATISPAQAIALAARIARALGIRVHDAGFPPSD